MYYFFFFSHQKRIITITRVFENSLFIWASFRTRHYFSVFNLQRKGRRTVCVCPASKALIRNVNNPRQWAVNHGSQSPAVGWSAKWNNGPFFGQSFGDESPVSRKHQTLLIMKTKKKRSQKNREKNTKRVILLRAQF